MFGGIRYKTRCQWFVRQTAETITSIPISCNLLNVNVASADTGKEYSIVVFAIDINDNSTVKLIGGYSGDAYNSVKCYCFLIGY